MVLEVYINTFIKGFTISNLNTIHIPLPLTLLFTLNSQIGLVSVVGPLASVTVENFEDVHFSKPLQCRWLFVCIYVYIPALYYYFYSYIYLHDIFFVIKVLLQPVNVFPSTLTQPYSDAIINNPTTETIFIKGLEGSGVLGPNQEGVRRIPKS